MLPPPPYYLGADVGGTKTHLVLATADGQVVGFGKAGPGNHEGVGFDGLTQALRTALEEACAGVIPLEAIAGGGFGLGGLDFAAEEPAHRAAIGELGLNAPIRAVNDAVIGLVAGSTNGWGVGLVSGTGSTCWGWDAARSRFGQVSGHGRFGEAGGATDLVEKAIQAVSYQWTRRGPRTRLSDAFIDLCGAANLEDLIEGIISERYTLDPSMAPLVFQVAEAGDAVAVDAIRWIASELAELAKAVIRQLDFQELSFDLVLIGSLYSGGSLLIEPLEQSVLAFAPRAHLVRLSTPPVVGAVLLGMEAAQVPWSEATRAALVTSLAHFDASPRVETAG